MYNSQPSDPLKPLKTAPLAQWKYCFSWCNNKTSVERWYIVWLCMIMYLTGRNKSSQKYNKRSIKRCERLTKKQKKETVAVLHQREFSSQAKHSPNKTLQICRPMLKKKKKLKKMYPTYAKRHGVIPSSDRTRHACNVCITLFGKRNKTYIQHFFNTASYK